MPSHRVHLEIDKVIFGKAFPEVHKAKDEPYATMGIFHRLLYHDPFYNIFISGNPVVATVHDIADAAFLPLAPLALLVKPEFVLD